MTRRGMPTNTVSWSACPRSQARGSSSQRPCQAEGEDLRRDCRSQSRCRPRVYRWCFVVARRRPSRCCWATRRTRTRSRSVLRPVEFDAWAFSPWESPAAVHDDHGRVRNTSGVTSSSRWADLLAQVSPGSAHPRRRTRTMARTRMPYILPRRQPPGGYLAGAILPVRCRRRTG